MNYKEILFIWRSAASGITAENVIRDRQTVIFTCESLKRCAIQGTMIFEWESEEDRLIRLMKIPPEKKLEWLNEMNEFTVKCSSKSKKVLRWKLREMK